MTAPLTPATLNLIRRNAGRVPSCEIASALGWTLDKLERVAREQRLSLRIDPPPPNPLPDPLSAAGNLSRNAAIRRNETFTVRLRPADAQILRDKAKARMTNPSHLLAEIFEGALARGKIDEMASAAGWYHPNETGDRP